MTRAYVVGSGPNGLAGAIRLAQEGVDVTIVETEKTLGGGLKSADLLGEGLVHDLGASFLPLAAASPFFRSLDLASHGVNFVESKVSLAHPLDDGSAALLHRDLSTTVQALGTDASAWRHLFEKVTRSFDDLLEDVMRPLVHWPRHPAALARYGLLASQAATGLVHTFRREPTRALFTGIAAHAFGRLDVPYSSAIGVMLTAAGHAYGWPVVQGGAGRLAEGLESEFLRLGGRVETGRTVTDLRELDADVILLDTTPASASRIIGEQLHERRRRAYGQYEHGPGAFKVDFAIDGDIPWTAEGVADAGVVHVGGSSAEIARAEADIVEGRPSRKPFVLVGQQYRADPSRSAGRLNPIWAYAHVPYGYSGDSTDRIIRQIERFAPGFKERIVSTVVTGSMGLAAGNHNFVGGDINTGANTFRQLIARPTFGPDPYRTGVKGVYLASAATPPGPGVHGMSGVNAARAALRRL